MSKNWEIVIFTAGLKEYADPIINDLDTQRHISRRFYRDSCVNVEGIYIKDLTKLGTQVDFSKIVIVDNIAANFSL